MRTFSLTILALLISQIGLAQIDTAKVLDKALESGNAMVQAYLNGDYDRFIDLNHPKIVELTGGKEQMKELLSRGLGPNVELLKNDLFRPSVLIIENSVYQCAFSQKQVLSVDGKKLYTVGSLIGLSYDEGKNWSFVGVSSNTLKGLQVYFPELSDRLSVNPQTKPVPIKD